MSIKSKNFIKYPLCKTFRFLDFYFRQMESLTLYLQLVDTACACYPFVPTKAWDDLGLTIDADFAMLPCFG